MIRDAPTPAHTPPSASDPIPSASPQYSATPHAMSPPTTVAVTLLPSANRGSGFCASASASISANVCPVPANNFSACAGLNVAENIAPCSIRQRRMLRRHRVRIRSDRQPHPRLRSAARHPLPAKVHRLRSRNRNTPHRPRIPQRLRQRSSPRITTSSGPGKSAGPPLIYTTILPFRLRPWHLGRIEVVILRLRQMQPIPDKHQRRIHRPRLRHRDPRIASSPKHQRRRLPIHHQAHRRLLRHAPAAHRTSPADSSSPSTPAGVQSVRLELIDHISRRLQILLTPGQPPVHRRISQILHMRPPHLTLRLIARSAGPAATTPRAH